MNKTIKCLVCEQNISPINIRSFQDEINLCKCPECKTEFLYPQPSQIQLDQCYKNYFNKRSTQFKKTKVPHFEKLIESLNIDLNYKRILEVGCGEGDFIRAVKNKFPHAQCTAVEKNNENIDYMKDVECKHLNQSIEEFLHLSEHEKYDYVFMFDVIEHLTNPTNVIQELFNMKISSGGFLIMTFPNPNTLSRKTLGKFWPQYKMEHLFYIQENGLSAITNHLSLTLIKILPLKKYLPISYLLSVGSHFGPELLQALTSKIARLIPQWLQKKSISLKLGESIAVIKNK